MEKTSHLIAGAAFLAVVLNPAPGVAQPIGQWDFNAGNLSATAGDALVYVDGPGGATETGTAFGSTTSFAIPNIGGAPAQVMKFPANTTPQGYLMFFSAPPNGGGGLVNQYTLVFDLLYPTESASSIRPLAETDGRVLDLDHDLGINAAGGIGGAGAFSGQIAPNTWYRIGFVVDAAANVIHKYVNGEAVGTQSATSGALAPVDGRWSINGGSGVELFNDDNGQAAVGYVNSIQLRDVPLSPDQMRALGGPSAAGIPQEIPPIPSVVEKWIPRTEIAARNTDIGAVINLGDNTVAESSVSLRLNGVQQTGLTFSTDGTRLTVRKANTALFPLGPIDQVLQLTYTGSIDGAKTISRTFRSALLFEDFEEVPLGQRIDEGVPVEGETVWTETPPDGWVIDDSGIPGIADVSTDGVTEWAGWSFANKTWWATVGGDQGRSQFASASGNVAIADPDEWDDKSHEIGLYNAYMSTPSISLVGLAPNSIFIKFDSAWQAECCDDRAELDNDQTAVVSVSFDGAAPVEVMRWSSDQAKPNYHGDNDNESVSIAVNNPAGAGEMVINFGLILAENDWFWALDNLLVNAGVATALLTSQPPPIVTATEGQSATFSVTATGPTPITFQWLKDGNPIPNATSPQYVISPVALSDVGVYRVRVTNPGGTVQSSESRLVVLPAATGGVTNDLVVHLKFDDDLNDAIADDTSGRGNHGTVAGAPSYVPGRLGTALRYSNARDGSFFDYISLGTPEDLNFGSDVNFSFSFWTKFTEWTGDPSFISNKNWRDGGTVGYVIATAGNGGLQWNAAPSRIDYDGPGGTLANNNWHHVVFSWDRSGLISTYLDGVQVNNTPNGAVRDLNSGLPTNIGQDGTGTYTDGGGVGIADGTIDDVGIWRRAISPAEATAIYQAGLAGKDLSQATLPPPVSTDLVAYLGFEDNLTDTSGRGHNGAAVGNVSFVSGRVGKGLAYSSKKDGTSFNYVTLGTPVDLNFGTSQSFSVSFWSKLNTWLGDPAFVANKDWASGNNPGWVIATDGDGRIQWNIAANPDGSNGSRRDYDSPGGIFTDSNWHHITVVFLRQPGSGVARTFVDGALLNESTWAGVDNQLNTAPGKATNIGQDGAGSYTDGNSVEVDAVIDEVAIWRRALSADEVEGLYAAGVVGVPVTSASPALALRLPPGKVSTALSAGTLSLNWKANQGVRLQRATSLVPSDWSDVPTTLGDDHFEAPIDPTKNEYFRLLRP